MRFAFASTAPVSEKRDRLAPAQDDETRRASEEEQRTRGVREKPQARSEEYMLVRRAVRGDRDAQDALFGRYRSRLYRLALRLLRSKEDAEDAVQDALLSAYRNLDSFQGRSLFSTWLTRIVVNAALVRMRRQRARPELFLQDACPEDQFFMTRTLIDSRPDPEQVHASFETTQLVEGAVEELSPSIRVAFRLRDLLELSNGEAAELMGVEVGAFKSRISRARSQLAKRFSPAVIAPLHKSLLAPIPRQRAMYEEPACSLG